MMKPGSLADVEKAGPPLVTVSVSFGPRFSDKQLTNEQFVGRLRDEAKHHPGSFLSSMMNHFADHISLGFDVGTLKPTDIADDNPNTTYYGHGSCTGCPGDQGQGYECCLCVYNGQNVGCESC
jgi:hypothetical protein